MYIPPLRVPIGAMVNNKPIIRGALFDMDGLLFDTERLSLELWYAASAEHGYDMPSELLKRLIGRTATDGRRILLKELGESFPYDSIVAGYAEIGRKRVLDEGVPRKSGVERLLQYLTERNVPRAVATSSPRATAEFLLREADIYELFNALVTGDDVTKGKPAPDIFELAAERLGVPPQHCVVFEDSPAGIRAAAAAGALPVLIPDLISPDPEIRALCFAECVDLDDARELLAARTSLGAVGTR